MKINQMVTPQEGEGLVVKNFPNSFRDTSLLRILKKIETENGSKLSMLFQIQETELFPETTTV